MRCKSRLRNPTPLLPGQPKPRLELAGFRRVSLAPRQRATVPFTLAPEELRLFNAQGERTLQPSRWQVFVSGAQPERRGSGPAPNVLAGIVRMR